MASPTASLTIDLILSFSKALWLIDAVSVDSVVGVCCGWRSPDASVERADPLPPAEVLFVEAILEDSPLEVDGLVAEDDVLAALSTSHLWSFAACCRLQFAHLNCEGGRKQLR